MFLPLHHLLTVQKKQGKDNNIGLMILCLETLTFLIIKRGETSTFSVYIIIPENAVGVF